jgi:hypothetical protein
LETLGLSWGKNLTAENHVLRCQRWSRCRLPRSVNTIAEDMRLDVPADRLPSYAVFLNIPIHILQDATVTAGSDAFTQAVVQARVKAEAMNLPLFTAFSPAFCKQFYHNNHPDYSAALFEQIRGLYSLKVFLPPSPEVYNSCVIVHSNQGNLLRALAFMVMHDIEVQFESIIYRWGNNLHISYYSMDMFIFGRLIAVDPLRYFTISHRKPFSLNLSGVSDAITGPQTFGFIFARGELLAQPPEPDLWEQWRRTCQSIRRQPLLLPEDAAYGRTLARLLPQHHAGPGCISPRKP